MNRLRSRNLALLLAMLTLTAPAWSDEPMLKLTASDWTPYVDSSQPRRGVVVVMVSTALKRAGYATSLKFEPWPDSLEKTAAGEYDVLVSIWQTPERAKRFAISEPFLVNRVTLMGKGSKPYSINDKADLAGLRIGVVEDYAYSAKAYDTSGLDIVQGGSVQENVERLLADELDIIVGDHLAMRYEVDRKSAARQITISPDAIETRGLRIAVSRKREDHEAIVAAFDSAIAEMKSDGTYNDILGGYGISQ